MEEKEKSAIINDITEKYPDEQFLVADGFDEDIIGVDEQEMRLIYSVSKCLNILEKDKDMSELDAQEYFAFNVSGAFFGKKTPIWCWDIYS